ncbi:hypothetical protein D1AOALGA4SA_3890 [Olavius algarvensis Delta 1 endosymbiont]|nr:hypothetical protein D1AOALGA4SA_3890 [Olavius algarvensis Delta 1 endosymbiont]
MFKTVQAGRRKQFLRRIAARIVRLGFSSEIAFVIGNCFISAGGGFRASDFGFKSLRQLSCPLPGDFLRHANTGEVFYFFFDY